jgi:DNA-directed RNA polymerase specialized sigma24 family protein
VRFAIRCTDPQTARDVAAETFLQAWRRLDTIPKGKELPSSTRLPAMSSTTNGAYE